MADQDGVPERPVTAPVPPRYFPRPLPYRPVPAPVAKPPTSPVVETPVPETVELPAIPQRPAIPTARPPLPAWSRPKISPPVSVPPQVEKPKPVAEPKPAAVIAAKELATPLFSSAKQKAIDEVLSEMENQPWALDFFQAVRQLECARPDLPRVGEAEVPSRESVRFSQEPLTGFSPSTIKSFRKSAATANNKPQSHAGPPAKMVVNFMGLFGPNGPLPLNLSQYARSRRARGDRTLVRFVDIFHHRMISLFYRAWSLHQRVVGRDRPGKDPYSKYLGSLFGIGIDVFRNRDSVPDVAKLHFAGRMATQTRSADGLAAILTAYFAVPSRIESFVGTWIQLPTENRCRLGESPLTGTLSNSLVVGGRVWDCQHKFRIHLGPMSFEDYRRLLPGTPGFKRLTDWVKNYCGLAMDWDVQLTLDKKSVPRIQVGSIGQLGWSSWLVSKPQDRHRSDLITGSRAG